MKREAYNFDATPESFALYRELNEIAEEIESCRLKKLLNFRSNYSNKLSYDDLINAESELGRTLFGPIPVGHQREFFEHKKNVWIWYEGWLDDGGISHGLTIRYEVRPDGVFKKIAGEKYKKLEGDELNNFCNAVRSYFKLVKTKLYC